MATGTPGRQARLLVATGAGRTAFAQSMMHLIDIGLVERNPGHGHPLRPEFRLTPKGAEVGALAHQIFGLVSEKDKPLMRKSWTLPIIAVLPGHQHFNDLSRALTPVTDRALSQTLKLLEEGQWVIRKVDDQSRPPRSIYSLSSKGEKLSDIMRSGL
jgi:DNA-binding HxlR family transcriptional regulator